MSPRRRIVSGEPPLFGPPPSSLRDRALARVAAGTRGERPQWRQPIRFALAGAVMAASLATSALATGYHYSQHRWAMRQADMLVVVRSFMVDFTSPDPYRANDYVNRLVAQGTGEFTRQFQEKKDAALVQIARGEPATGTILDTGIQNYNDDGSANVLVATRVHTVSEDGKSVVDMVYRWIVTAQREGAQWKISSLIQVI